MRSVDRKHVRTHRLANEYPITDPQLPTNKQHTRTWMGSSTFFHNIPKWVAQDRRQYDKVLCCLMSILVSDDRLSFLAQNSVAFANSFNNTDSNMQQWASTRSSVVSQPQTRTPTNWWGRAKTILIPKRLSYIMLAIISPENVYAHPCIDSNVQNERGDNMKRPIYEMHRWWLDHLRPVFGGTKQHDLRFAADRKMLTTSFPVRMKRPSGTTFV